GNHELDRAARGRARLLADDVGQPLGRDAPDREVRGRAVEVAGAADGFPDVLVVVPAVEDADLHELAVRAGAFGRESLAVPVLLRERAQRVELGRGNGTELVEHLRARPVAIALDPPLVRLADVVADVRRVGTG